MATFGFPGVVNPSRTQYSIRASTQKACVNGRQALQIECRSVKNLYIRRWDKPLNEVCPVLGIRRMKAGRKTRYSTHQYFRQPHMNTWKIWWEAGQRQVFLRCSVRGWKTIMKNGIDKVAQDKGIDLEALDFVDWSPEALKFRERYKTYLPYQMYYGPPYNRKQKDPKRIAQVDSLLVKKFLDGRVVQERLSLQEAIDCRVFPDEAVPFLPDNLRRRAIDKSKSDQAGAGITLID